MQADLRAFLDVLDGTAGSSGCHERSIPTPSSARS